jgi:hypothetical protein
MCAVCCPLARLFPYCTACIDTRLQWQDATRAFSTECESMSRRWCIVLFSAACGGAHAAVTAQSFSVTASQSSPYVLANTGAESPRPVGAGATWPVTTNTGQLESQPASVVFNFPDRGYATITRMRFEHRDTGFLWTGKGDGCVAVFTLDTVGFHGVISCLNANYGIQDQTLTRYDGIPGSSVTAWGRQANSTTYRN